MRNLRHLGRREEGASVIELALVLPVLLMLLVGMVDVGRAFSGQIVLINAARAGVRYASRYPLVSSGIVATVRTEASGSGLTPGAISVSISGLGAASGDPIRVTTQYSFPTVLGGFFGHPTITLRGSAQMIVFGRRE